MAARGWGFKTTEQGRMLRRTIQETGQEYAQQHSHPSPIYNPSRSATHASPESHFCTMSNKPKSMCVSPVRFLRGPDACNWGQLRQCHVAELEMDPNNMKLPKPLDSRSGASSDTQSAQFHNAPWSSVPSASVHIFCLY